MHGTSALFRFFSVLICLPLVVSANAQENKKSDCRSRITHSGFAEFVMPREGATHKLEIKVSPSVKWTIRNNNYVDWIAIRDGDSGTGPGTLTIQLETNPGNLCRVGELSIAGIVPIYALPIRVLQPGTGTVTEERQEKLLPYVVDLEPFSNSKVQNPGKSEYKKPSKKP